MEQYVFPGFWAMVLIGQAALCFLTKRLWVKLIPAPVLLLLMVLCFGIYAATTNWAYLIFLIVLLIGLLIVGGVWAVYGCWKLVKIILLSRKNT